MNEESQNDRMDSDLEARIAALVHGEASASEQEALNRLIQERPELQALKKQFESVDSLIREVAAGEEPPADDQDWKLPADRRRKVLSVISGQSQETGGPQPLVQSNRFWNVTRVTVSLCVAGLFLMLATGSYVLLRATRASRVGQAATDSRQMLESFEYSMQLPDAETPRAESATAAPSVMLFAEREEAQSGSERRFRNGRAAKPAEPTGAPVVDFEMDSKASLSAIEDHLAAGAIVAESDQPSAYYLQDDVQYYPTVPQVTLSESAVTLSDSESGANQADKLKRESVEAKGLGTPADSAPQFSAGRRQRFDQEFDFSDESLAVEPPPIDSLAADPQPSADGSEWRFGRAGMQRGVAERLADDRSGVERSKNLGLLTPPAGPSDFDVAKNRDWGVAGGGGFGGGMGGGQGAWQEQLEKQLDAPQQQIAQDGQQLWDATQELEGRGTGMDESMMGMGGMAMGMEMDVEMSMDDEMAMGGEVGMDGAMGTDGGVAAPRSGEAAADHYGNSNALSFSMPSPTTAPAPANRPTDSTKELAELGDVTSPEPTTEPIAKGRIIVPETRELETRGLAAAGTRVSGLGEQVPELGLRITGSGRQATMAGKDLSYGIQPAEKVPQAADRWYDQMQPQSAQPQAGQSQRGKSQADQAQGIASNLEGLERFSRRASADQANSESLQELERLQQRGEVASRSNGQANLSGPESLIPEMLSKSKFLKRSSVEKTPVPAGLDEKYAGEEAFSTFSLHVSDVSFKLAAAALAQGQWPEAAKIRIEEFVNALDYGDPMPGQDEKVSCQLEQAIHPFLQQRNLLRVSMRTAAAGRASNTPLRLTFLLDNSGSMERIDRQQTVRRAFTLLAEQLKAGDQVTLIGFARTPRLLADKVDGAQSQPLVDLIQRLPSQGGTNIEAALQLAFEKAQEQHDADAQNRIVLLTDGAVNLGDADPESLSRLITTIRESGIALDAAGIVAEGLNDEVLEALTRQGDGRYYLLDSPQDADDGFVRQIAGALRPSAKNVKVQIEFNPKRVGRYKLLGFEKHLLKTEDFRNDKVDAAEMAAAEAGVAVYQFQALPDGEGDVGSVSVRFRDLSTGQMVENRWPIPYQPDAARPDQAAPSMQLASAAALFAAKLRGEPLGASVDLKTLADLLSGLPEPYRNAKRIQQLRQMIGQARQIGGG
ncbi:von Willebrand factor [Stieleria maiorica]|uniref:von Willebrand factor n=1 Tax=Stieleria maiorica TaxID=2795974 RepID=A0A5B9MB45_9BACT|nr:von Willebrand factor type A domain-containing protein [Stieleria maiorica]QEF96745.1 von Willebrand factor [Stieleria maiorica]